MDDFMPKTEYIKVEKKDHIAIVTMHRAPVNAANRQFYQEMTDVFDAIGADKEIRVAILRSEFEKYWCAGNDINDFAGMTPESGHIRHRVVYNSFVAVFDQVRHNCLLPDAYCLILAVTGQWSDMNTPSSITLCVSCDSVFMPFRMKI